jgi:putative tryptophan/tyrosine transport system substrate-binding protein
LINKEFTAKSNAFSAKQNQSQQKRGNITMNFTHHLISKGARLVSVLLFLGAILVLSSCDNQTTAKIYRVGILAGLSPLAPITEGFKAKMTDLGYVEGQNIIYDVQQPGVDIAAYKRILQKFVDDKVDLILVFPTEAAIEAKPITQGTNIPVIFANVLIEGMDIVKSVREPGGNMTGVRYPGSDIALKRFEIMRQLVPQAKRMLVVYRKDTPIVPPQLEMLRPAAEAAGITLIEVPATNTADLETKLQSLAKTPNFGIDAVFMLVEPLAGTPDTFAVLGKFAAEHNAPVGGIIASAGEYETLFGLSINTKDAGQLAAPLADKIFKGIPVGTIPVVSSEPFLRINYKAAQKQGITVPEGLLSQADEIIR